MGGMMGMMGGMGGMGGMPGMGGGGGAMPGMGGGMGGMPGMGGGAMGGAGGGGMGPKPATPGPAPNIMSSLSPHMMMGLGLGMMNPGFAQNLGSLAGGAQGMGQAAGGLGKQLGAAGGQIGSTMGGIGNQLAGMVPGMGGGSAKPPGGSQPGQQPGAGGGGMKPPALGQAAASKAPGQGMDNTFQRMLHQESGDHQFSKGGGVVTSPKGALGAAQVMPGTGPVAAQYAGLKWDPQRLRTDSGYNKALGQAYYDHQLKTYGSPEKAAAAYNAGPGNLQKALDKGAKTGTPWQSHLPKETQHYIQAVTGGRTPSQHASSTPQGPKSTPSSSPAAKPASTPIAPPAGDSSTPPGVLQAMQQAVPSAMGSSGQGLSSMLGGMGGGSKGSGSGQQQQSQGGGKDKGKDDLIKIPDAPPPAPNYFAKNQGGQGGGSPWQKAYKNPNASLSDIIQAA